MEQIKLPGTGMAFSYHRFSSKKQKKGTTEDRQGEMTDYLCKRFELTLRDTIAMEGVSAARGKNLKALMRLLDDGTIQPGDTLLIEALDRFTRLNPFDAQPYLHRLCEHKVNIIVGSPEMIITPQRIREEPALLLMMVVLMQRAREETKRKIELSKKAVAIRRKENLEAKSKEPNAYPVTSTIAPYGIQVIKRDKKRYAEIHPDESKVIKRVFALATDGVSIGEITRIINDDGHRTRNGKPWATSSVWKVLKSRAYVGELEQYQTTHDGDTDNRIDTKVSKVKDYYPAIIDQKTWTQANATIRPRISKTTNRTGKSNLLTGFAKCRCGKALWVDDKGAGLPKLACRSKWSSNGKRCKAPRISTMIAEATVVNAVIQHLKPENLLNRNTDKKQIETVTRNLKTLANDIGKAKKEIDVMNRNLARAKTDKQFQTIAGQIEIAEKRMASMESEERTLESDLVRLSKGSDELTKRRNQIEDLCIQAVLGMPGNVRTEMQVFAFDESITFEQKEDTKQLRQQKAWFTSVEPITETEKNQCRLKLKTILDQLVKSARFGAKGICTVTMYDGDVITVPTLDVDTCDAWAMGEAFDGMFLRYLAACGPKTMIDKARSMVAKMDAWVAETMDVAEIQQDDDRYKKDIEAILSDK